MDDPIQRHPTRAEQLDVLVSLIADQARTGDRALDLGCGTGYVAHLLLPRAPGLHLTGVDLSAESIAAAQENLAEHAGRFAGVVGDLSSAESIEVAPGPFRFVYSCLTFHDLTHDDKRAVIAWAASRLADDGFLLVYDRIRLTEAPLFPLQASVWARIERVHGRGMRSSADWDGYRGDLGPANDPASLADYLGWMDEAGLASGCIHLHGNIALVAGSPRVG